MKAITICQPWAYAICYRGKDVENRTWYTSYRGSLAIHAGKSRVWFTGEALNDGSPEPGQSSCVFGAIVAHCELVDCIRPKALPGNVWAEGPWCFVLEDVRVLDVPVPYKGAQGLWDVFGPEELDIAYGANRLATNKAKP